MAIADWRDFWNGEHAIYVNGRHRHCHDVRVARDLAALIPSAGAVMLDYGCGETTAAEYVAQRCGQLLMCDAAPSVREKLFARYAPCPKIGVLSPDEVQALREKSVDLIVVNSVLQYLSLGQWEGLLTQFHRLLKEDGKLIVGDVIPRNISPIHDAIALLRFAFEGGFLVSAMAGLTRTFFSDYRRLRSTLGLMRYDEHEFKATLENARFAAQRRRPNLGHNDRRMTFVACKVRE